MPGATHDLTAARSHGIVDAFAAAGLKCWADNAYQGAGWHIRVLSRGRRLKLEAAAQQQSHQDLLRRRAGHGRAERLAPLRKLRCSTNRITDIVKAVLVLHHASTRGWRKLLLRTSTHHRQMSGSIRRTFGPNR
ncbi:hypothetical protein [Streptomyces anulatus]|uniref:hypothetical protein n=1 Tax=Streptomyces anulatus TaxID=1892 RepID=UPI00364F01E5